MNKLEVGKTYLLAAINGKYPRHSINVQSELVCGDFLCDILYAADDEDTGVACRFSSDGVARKLGADVRVDWDKVNFTDAPVAVPPCVAHTQCDEQMQTSQVVGFREALATVEGLAAEVAVPRTVGVKADKGKAKPRLLHESMAEAVASVVDVLTFGAAKYDDDNWKNVEPKRYTDAMYRHLNAHHRGEKVDDESGLPHLAHAACCVLFLLHHEVKSD